MANQNENQKKEESFIVQYKKEIFGGILVLIAVIFFFKNDEEATFWYFIGSAKAPLVVFLVLFYGFGFLTHFIISYFAKKDLKKQIKDLEKGNPAGQHKEDLNKIKTLEEKIEKLEKALEKNNPTPPPAV